MSQSFGVGTPPTGRRVSPAPRRRSSVDQRSSVVPFSRPASTGRLADNQNNSFEKNFRPSLSSQSQSVASRPSFTKYSFDVSTPTHAPGSSPPVIASKFADSPFSRQEGFAANRADDPAQRDSQAVLASPLESPGRTKSTSLLSQQLNRELSFKVGESCCFCCRFAASVIVFPGSLKSCSQVNSVAAEVFGNLP